MHLSPEVELHGTPVVTSPYFGVESQYDGSSLIVSISSINQDLTLLQQWQQLENHLNSDNKSFPEKSLVELSGKLEAQANYHRPYVGHSTSDIDLTGLELDVSAAINRWTTGFMALNYDNSPLATDATRADNSKLFVNKAFITLGNLNSSPFYLTAGQFYVPFGKYSSFMVSSPLTLHMARTKARALLLGYHPKTNDGLYGSLYTFKGDSHTLNNENKINQWGGNIAYDYIGKGYKLTLGGSYINNLADAAGMQDNGLANGFGAVSASGLDNETLQHKVAGADIQGKLSVGPMVFLAEYLTATRAFDASDMMYNGNGAKPSALNLEAAYLFNLRDKPSSIALGYGQTRQALAMNLPKNRYSVTLNTSQWKDTVLSLQYKHDVAYGQNDMGGGKGSYYSAINTPALGESDDSLTLQFGVYF